MKRRNAYWLAVSGVFLLFFRARSAFTISGQYDDVCYVQWLYRLLGVSFSQTCYADFYLPGPALFWFPGGVLALITARLSGTSVDAWIPIFIGVTAFACWAASLFFIDRIMRHFRPDSPAWLSLVTLAAIPVLYYCTARSCMAHAPEIFLSSAIVYLLLRKQIWVPLLLAFWLTLVRVNDAPIIFVVLARAWDLHPVGPFRQRLAFLAAVLSVPLLWFAFVKGYGGADYLHKILGEITPAEIARTFFEGRDGLLWSGPWWLACLSLGIVSLRSLSWMSRVAAAWMLLLLLVCIGWTTSGGNLFYRYLIGTYPVAIVILMERWPQLSTRTQRIFQGLLVYEAVYLTVVTWINASRYQDFFGAVSSASGLGWVKAAVAPVLLVGVSPPGLSAFSWMGDRLTRWFSVPPPDYTLQGPALWALSLLSLAGIAVLTWSLRQTFERKNPLS